MGVIVCFDAFGFIWGGQRCWWSVGCGEGVVEGPGELF